MSENVEAKKQEGRREGYFTPQNFSCENPTRITSGNPMEFQPGGITWEILWAESYALSIFNNIYI
jgi:hypothetical protein